VKIEEATGQVDQAVVALVKTEVTSDPVTIAPVKIEEAIVQAAALVKTEVTSDPVTIALVKTEEAIVQAAALVKIEEAIGQVDQAVAALVKTEVTSDPVTIALVKTEEKAARGTASRSTLWLMSLLSWRPRDGLGSSQELCVVGSPNLGQMIQGRGKILLNRSPRWPIELVLFVTCQTRRKERRGSVLKSEPHVEADATRSMNLIAIFRRACSLWRAERYWRLPRLTSVIVLTKHYAA
ncbi:MAG: hypothetical protein ACYDED_09965, partial [Ferrimicrobium sp.]